MKSKKKTLQAQRTSPGLFVRGTHSVPRGSRPWLTTVAFSRLKAGDKTTPLPTLHRYCGARTEDHQNGKLFRRRSLARLLPFLEGPSSHGIRAISSQEGFETPRKYGGVSKVRWAVAEHKELPARSLRKRAKVELRSPRKGKNRCEIECNTNGRFPWAPF